MVVSKVEAERLQRLESYKDIFGWNYPTLQYLLKDKQELEEYVTGRIISIRSMKKSTFIVLSHNNIRTQIYVEHTIEVSKKLSLLDIGDIVFARGVFFTTKTGEVTLRVTFFDLLSKAIRPIDFKNKIGDDKEYSYRNRPLDLLINEESRERFITRNRVINKIRSLMSDYNFMEVETPMLHRISGGASAKPFKTYHNALDMEMSLRIAPELYLKRLLVGGFEKVFEINRNFRNEGISTRHNPEFTMMEFYEAYSDYKGMMDLTEKLLKEIVLYVFGTSTVEYLGELIYFSTFDRLSIVEAILKYNNSYTLKDLNDVEFLKRNILSNGEKLPVNSEDIGSLQLALFEATTEKKLWNPTFITDYPVSTSPLARESDTNKGFTDRFELFIAGRELANGYTELNDPKDQSERFLEQLKQKENGDEEAMNYDEDYIKDLEYGMPPSGGCGIGIDRLVMLLTDAESIRDVVLFPHLRSLQ